MRFIFRPFGLNSVLLVVFLIMVNFVVVAIAEYKFLSPFEIKIIKKMLVLIAFLFCYRLLIRKIIILIIKICFLNRTNYWF